MAKSFHEPVCDLERELGQESMQELAQEITSNDYLKSYCSRKVNLISFLRNKGGPGESTFIANAAVILAQDGHEVYLLDINSQNNSQGQMMQELVEKEYTAQPVMNIFIDADKSLFKADPQLFAQYFAPTLVRGLYMMTARDPFETGKIDNLLEKIEAMRDNFESEVREEVLARVDCTELQSKIGAEQNSQKYRKEIISEYISGLCSRLDNGHAIKNRVILADTSPDMSSVLQSKDVFEMIALMSAEVSAVRQTNDFFYRLRKESFERNEPKYTQEKLFDLKKIIFGEIEENEYGIDFSEGLKERLKELISIYESPVEGIKKIESPDELAQEIGAVFEKAAFDDLQWSIDKHFNDFAVSFTERVTQGKYAGKEEIDAVISRKKAEREQINRLFDRVLFGRSSGRELLRELKKINEREKRKYEDRKYRGEQIDEWFYANMRKTMEYVEQRLEKIITMHIQGNKEVPDAFYTNFQKALKKDELRLIRQWENSDKERYDAINFLATLMRRGHEEKIGEIYKKIPTIFKNKDYGRQLIESGVTIEGARVLRTKNSNGLMLVTDVDAANIINELKAELKIVGIEPMLSLIDKYSSDGCGRISDINTLISEMPDSFKELASSTFEKYQKAAGIIKSSLRSDYPVKILLSRIPKQNPVCIENIVRELKKADNCEPRIIGAIEQDDFVRKASEATAIPFVLLKQNYQLSMNGSGLVRGYGRERQCAEDIRDAIYSIINGQSQSLEKFMHTEQYNARQREVPDAAKKKKSRPAIIEFLLSGIPNIIPKIFAKKKKSAKKKK